MNSVLGQEFHLEIILPLVSQWVQFVFMLQLLMFAAVAMPCRILTYFSKNLLKVSESQY